MSLNIRPIVAEHLKNNYDVEFDMNFEKAWSILKNNFGAFLGFTILCGLFCVCLFGLLMGPILILGFSTYSYASAKNHASFSSFFNPFSKFGSLFFLSILFFVVNVLISLPTLLNSIPIYLEYIPRLGDKEAIKEMGEALQSVSSLSSFYSSIIQFLISVLTFYAPYLVYYGDYSVIEAIGVSIQLVVKKIWILIAILLLSVIIKYGGFVLCCVGEFITFPFVYILYHQLFTQIILNKVQESESIQSSF